MGQGRQLANKTQGEQDKADSLKRRLKEGYAQMAELNLRLAQEGLMADREAYQRI
ncbi:hypothetical protein Halha_0289 [Halobacteroides halobius DSM 5150]|uniref:Uncharacterized protein n=1 Tax=Halobacteroides halobius (strain ATCC 35273 / DSM 5150 / MD-1) TaxID=748449 RepID=L0K706_HALHC|nr:hypothetical protein [Halobacteroides halobius]AGB40300.1 hypothetical protein Halha_0289 [Halobacteroides halobius DSM 5150]